MRTIFILTITFISLSFSFFNSETSKFSGDPEFYIEELKAYMQNVSDEQEERVEIFIKAWEEDSLFTEQEQKDIARLSLKLDKKNARPFPHFITFLDIMLTIQEKDIAPDQYSNWLNGFEFYLKRKKANSNEILRILNFSLDLFKDNLLYQSRSTKWRVTSGAYKINSKKGIVVEFENTGLVCYTRTDSINIFETSGYVDPSENVWQGSGGLVTWERGGYSRDQVYCELKKYSIQLKKSEYEAVDVVFNNKHYFDQPLKGKLHDKVQHIQSAQSATYPRFDSYKKTFEIEDLYKDVDYSGGLSMQGAKMIGQGSRENPAKLSIYRNDTLVLEATSLFFGFKSDRVASERTSIVIKLKQDSIYHPDLYFNFRTANRELTLLKTDNFSSQGPYYDSYHKIDMNFDQLIWRIDEDFMHFTAPRGASIGNAYFESENYFNMDKFMDLQIMDAAHPLYSIRSFSVKFGNDVFPLQAYANYLNQPLTTVKHLIMRMARNGFVFYDNNTETVTLKPRLFAYIAASVNKIDYDVMSFGSQVETPVENAVFDLRNYDLAVNGVPKISVSDHQNVGIIPKNAQIILKENRDFQFDGTVSAGLLSFYGKNLFFNYDSFKISLQNVDSVNIQFQTGKLDNFGLPVVANMQNKLENITGEILIDKPDNKSGRVEHPEYPIFRSKETSYVYYESKEVQEGVYSANDFYFAIDPFEMDSLDNYNAYAMEFKGSFSSAGIFPEFRKSLMLQEDNSLGFKHKTSPEGMPLYGGKGTYKNDIWLSNNGLRGNGSLDYLTSTTWSDDFQFYPDSMNTNSQKFQIKKQYGETQYPQTSSENNPVHWEPYNDVMWADKTDKEFTMFNDSTTLAGKLQLEPSGLFGWGRMDLKNSDLHSDWFRYKADDIFADTSEFYLKSLQKEGFTVLTENINSHIDYKRKEGVFKSNEDFSLVTFPENKYISYIDYFTWDMIDKKLVIGAQGKPQTPDYTDEDLEPAGPRYISIDPKQDSLNFVSPLAYYDYEHNLINATGVKFVEVADARIYPNEGLLTVQPDYLIKTLENAWVRANKTTKFHTLHTATINIKGRKYYDGMANYDYVDENDDIQIIHFKDVHVDSGGQTLAKGEIFQSAGFTLSPVFRYQGKVSLFADDSLLTFKGATKIEHNCDKLSPQWIAFESRINPDDIYIPVQAVSKNINNVDLYAGMFVYYDSVHVYPAFFNPHKNYSDNQMVTPSGFLHYDKPSQLYKVGSKAKINDFTLSEDYVSLHREDCRLYSEGNVKLGEKLGQVKLTNYGSVTHSVDENKTTLDLVMGIDFFLSEDMNNLFGHEVDSFPNLKPVNMQRSLYRKAMNGWITEPVAKKVQEEIDLFGTVKELPPELKHTILLNRINLVWNDLTNSYQSVGKIGIASINGVQVHKEVDGFFELRIKRSGDIMDLYLQLDRRNYYYFGYTRGIMQILSSNKQFVETIMNMKNKERKVKTSRKQTPYKFLISTDRKKNTFYKRWQDMLKNDEDEMEEDVL